MDKHMPCNKKRILIVDDEKIILHLFKMILSSALPDFEFDSANNGLEALETFKSKHHTLCLMDIHMPIMDGLSAFYEIKKVCEEKKWNPPAIIFCSGYAPPDIINDIISENSIICLLSKPIGNDALVATIKNMLSKVC